MVQKYGPDQNSIFVTYIKRMELETKQAAASNLPYVVLGLKRVSMAVNLQSKTGKFLNERRVGKGGWQLLAVRLRRDPVNQVFYEHGAPFEP